MKADDLRRNHEIVFFQAAFNYYSRHPEDIEPDCYSELSGLERLWASAIDNDTVAIAYFAECNETLRRLGYCILEGFLDDARTPKTVSDITLPRLQDGLFYKRLREDATQSLPAHENESGEPQEPFEWTHILNRGHKADEEARMKGIGRYLATNHGMTIAVEKNPLRSWAFKSRVLLDIRVGQAVAALRAWNNTSSERDNMFIPNSGGRWLYTSKKCDKQKIHTDFPTLSASQIQENSKCPGFFTICSGEREVRLWVCEGSHIRIAEVNSAGGDGLEYRRAGKVTPAAIVSIPPYSILVGRGDVMLQEREMSASRGTKAGCATTCMSRRRAMSSLMVFIWKPRSAPSSYRMAKTRKRKRGE